MSRTSDYEKMAAGEAAVTANHLRKQFNHSVYASGLLGFIALAGPYFFLFVHNQLGENFASFMTTIIGFIVCAGALITSVIVGFTAGGYWKQFQELELEMAKEAARSLVRDSEP